MRILQVDFDGKRNRRIGDRQCKPLLPAFVAWFYRQTVHRLLFPFGRQMALQSGRARSVRSQIVLSAVPYEPVCDYQSSRTPKPATRRDINHGWLFGEFRNRFRLRFIVLWLSALWRGSLSFTRGLLFFSVRAYSAGNLRLRICDFFGGTLRQRLNDLVAAVVQLCFVCFLTAGFCLLAAGLLPVRGCELVAGLSASDLSNL